MLRNMFFSGRTMNSSANSYLIFITDVRDSLLTDRDLGGHRAFAGCAGGVLHR